MAQRLAGSLPAFIAILSLAGCSTTTADLGAVTPPAYASAEPWVLDGAPSALRDAAARIAGTNKRLLIVLGADWCHDSVALAKYLQGPAMDPYRGRYETVFVDVGAPQHGKPFNSGIVKDLGLFPMKNTPALVIFDNAGRQLNSIADARSWRNAESRAAPEMAAYFDRWLAAR